MKKLFSILLISSVACSTALADNVYFEADFSRGLPSGTIVKDYDENPTMSGVSNVDFTKGSWSTALVEKGNPAAVSSSYTTYDYPVDDWMILPSVHVNSVEDVLAWDGISLHYDYREDYKVLISETGTDTDDFVEVYSVTDEDYFPRRHAISLANYVGKDIYVAFVHTGQDGFILAIDNIKIGEWMGEYALVNDTDVSAQGGSEVQIKGSIRNLSSATWFNPTLVIDGVETPYYGQDDEVIPPVMWEAGEEIAFSFTVTVPEDTIFKYTIKADDWTVTDSIFCSDFAHNLLVEKFTGTWCNGCPEGSITLHKLQQRYRNRIISVEGHVNDLMQDYYYATGLNRFSSNLPSLIYDRKVGFVSQSAQDDGFAAKVMAKDVSAEVVPSVKYLKDDKLEINSIVRFSQEYDNSKDRYRVGYAVVEDVVHVENEGYNQANNCQRISCREYYYLPSSIPSKRMYYHNIARGDSTAFDGVALSLPNESLTSGIDYETTYTMDIPSSVIDKKNISVVVFVINTRSHEVMNAARVAGEDFDWSNNVITVKPEASNYRYVVEQNCVVVSDVDAHALVKLYATDGRLLGTAVGSRVVAVDAHDYRGVAIVTVETAQGVQRNKVIIK